MGNFRKSRLGQNPLDSGGKTDQSSIRLTEATTDKLLFTPSEQETFPVIAVPNQPYREADKGGKPCQPEHGANEPVAVIADGLAEMRVKIAETVESLHSIDSVIQELFTEYRLPRIGNELRSSALIMQNAVRSIETLVGTWQRQLGCATETSAKTDCEGLIVRSAGELFLIPVSSVAEVFRLDEATAGSWNGRQVVQQRGQILAQFDLGRLLGIEATEKKTLNAGCNGYGVVLNAGREKFVVVVQELVRRQQVVIRPLPFGLGNCPGIGGVTSLGKGKTILVLAVEGLFTMAAACFQADWPAKHG